MMISSQSQQENIYNEYKDKIQRYIAAKVGSAVDAEDLTQQVFLKLFTAWDTFDGDKGKTAYVYSIARNTVIDYFRTRHIHIELETVRDALQSDEAIDAALLLSEQQEELANALDKLEQRERDTIILYYYSGKSLAEISRMMDLPYGRIKRLHQKALFKLKNILTK